MEAMCGVREVQQPGQEVLLPLLGTMHVCIIPVRMFQKSLSWGGGFICWTMVLTTVRTVTRGSITKEGALA